MSGRDPITVAWLGSPAGLRDPIAAVLATDESMRLSPVLEAGELLPAVRRLAVNLVAIDIDVARGNVVRAVEELMSVRPTPILVIAETGASSAPALRLIAAGALDAIQVSAPQIRTGQLAELRRMIRVLAPITVIGRRTPVSAARAIPAHPIGNMPPIVAIGASTGGPPALAQVLKKLPAHTSASVLVVQHMSKEFMPGFVDWLGASISLPVSIAVEGEPLRGGHVLVAPGDKHMAITSKGRVALHDGEMRHACRPSVDVLFESVAQVGGARSIGVLLTGMGRDGAEGLLRMREQDACTIAQSEMSAVIFGMPGAAVELGAAQYVMDLDDIAEAIRRRVTPGAV